MGAKPRAVAVGGLKARILFEPKRTSPSAASICAANGSVFVLGIESRGTPYFGGGIGNRDARVYRLDELTKQKRVPQPAGLGSLTIDDDLWLAGGLGGVFVSTDDGANWLFDPIDAFDYFHSVLRWDNKLWAAGMRGKLAVKSGGRWTPLERPNAPKFEGCARGTSLPYPRLALSKLIVTGEKLYALGQGIWHLDATGAELELASDRLVVALAETKAGTLIAGGIDGLLLRRERGRGDAWSPVDERGQAAEDMTCVEIIELAEGILFVGTNGEALHSSIDDGRTLSPLPTVPGLAAHLERFRFELAAADGQGGALIGGWGGLTVRVATEPLAWTKAKPKRRAKRRPPKPASVNPRERSSEVEARLIAEIFADRHSDSPRLVYADWLTEHGDPRGEFIALQCQLGRAIWGADGHLRHGDSNPPLPNVLALVERERKLFRRHRKEWLAPFGKAVRKPHWRRGFLEGFNSNRVFFDYAARIFAEHPVVTLRLDGLREGDFKRLRETELPGLESLSLGRQRMTAELLELVLGSPAVQALEHLDVWGNEFGDPGAGVIASRFPPQLKSIRMHWCGLTPVGVRALLDAAPKTLESIVIGYNNLDEEGWTAIQDHPRASLAMKN